MAQLTNIKNHGELKSDILMILANPKEKFFRVKVAPNQEPKQTHTLTKTLTVAHHTLTIPLLNL